MGNKFNNINEELERIKTLMFETDNFIKNGTPLNETVEETTEVSKDESVEETTDVSMDEKLLGKSGTKVIQKGKLASYVKGGGGSPVYKIIFTDNAQKYLQIDPKDKNSFILNPEGFKEAKNNGLPVKDGDLVRLVGKKDKQEKDSVLVTIIKPTEIGLVTTDMLTKVDPKKADQIPTATSVPGDTKVSAPSSVDTSKPETLKGKSFEELGIDVNKLVKGKGPKLSNNLTVYADTIKNPSKPTLYYVDNTTNKIDTVLSWEEKSTTKESFDTNSFYVNPLLFESVIVEQATTTTTGSYTCVGDSCPPDTDFFSKEVEKVFATTGEVKPEEKKEEEKTTTEEKIYTRTGDPYEYKVISGVWHARKKGTDGKWLDITKYKSSVDILNKEFPEAGGSSSTKTTTEPTPTPTPKPEPTPVTMGGPSGEWTKTFENGGTVSISYKNGFLEPTTENISGVIELVSSLIDSFDSPVNSQNLKDVGEYLKNLGFVKIDVSSFKDVVELPQNAGYFDGALDYFMEKNKTPLLLNFVNKMYSSEEGPQIPSEINTVCDTATMYSGLEDYRKYAKMYYGKYITCDWVKSSGGIS